MEEFVAVLITFSLCCSSSLNESVNTQVENEINITCLFPDATRPQPTNGGFENQEEFRKFVTGSQDGSWNCHLHSRPLSERIADYKDDAIALAFPSLFPYGYTGLVGDPALSRRRAKISEKARSKTRHQVDVLKKLLRHRNPAFHGPMFNLIVENIIMKNIIFEKSRIVCNTRFSETTKMGEKYGKMTAQELEHAINKVRYNLPSQYSSSAENRFLKSISAACEDLPHSNEASELARKTYFSFLMRFDLPAIFFTISPDDTRNYRIELYALKEVKPFGEYRLEDYSDRDILASMNVRRQVRFDHPGLCAEEYNQIIDLVIKHLFNWDSENQKSMGAGLFAVILAWCLATEEQGKKTLHGHFLIFVKNWTAIMAIIQCRKKKIVGGEEITPSKAMQDTKRFFSSICSARLFADFEPYKPLANHAVFAHNGCRSKQKGSKMRINIKPVSLQQLREMRHKAMCQHHRGHIGTCQRCNKPFTNDEIIANALSIHLGKGSRLFHFPERVVKPLDHYVYELQKDFNWHKASNTEMALRYFATNVATNAHLVTHTSRCFKKRPECYAHLPEAPYECTKIIHNSTVDIWSNWYGEKEDRYMFSLQPKQNIEDCYCNTHNPFVTSSLGCNNNILFCMAGPVVIYATGYNAKANQKEERNAFETVSRTLCNVLKNQVKLLCNAINENLSTMKQIGL